MAKTFPSELIVKIETDPSDKSLSWFMAGATMGEMLGMNCKDKLAVYKLVEVREVVTGVVSHKKLRTAQ